MDRERLIAPRRRAMLTRIAWRLIGVYAAVSIVFNVATAKFFDRYSRNADVARERDVFVRSVKANPPYITWRGDRYPVVETWIERKVRLRWHFLFAPWVTTEYHQLAFIPGRGARSDSLLSALDIAGTDSAIGYNDSLPAYPVGGAGRTVLLRVTEPFPDVIRLQVLPNAAPRRTAPK